MLGAYLPGDRRVDVRQVNDPAPGAGEVVVAMRASTICGSDVRAIYREHLGDGPEAYRNVIAGHEPCGEVVTVGSSVRRLRPGDRVVVYHISGCGQCDECRRGYQISCLSADRAAYGWQRDGGHADYLVACERDLLHLPENLSYLDGACVACGFGTAYEALCRVGVSGRDRVLITGLGPVGIATGLLAKAMGASAVVGIDPNSDRAGFALQLEAIDVAAPPGTDDLSDLLGDGAEVAVDCSGSGAGQLSALQNTRRWGRVALVGEGGRLTVDVSDTIIHRQLTLHGSWVTSTVRMSELLDRLARWDLHPGRVITHEFPITEADAAYRVADTGAKGKVGIVWSPSTSAVPVSRTSL